METSMSNSMSRRTFHKKINGSFALFLLVPVLSGLLAYRSVQGFIQSSRWVAHTHQVIGELTATLSTVQDAETGQRGYLLTGQERYIAPYSRASGQVQTRIAALRRLTADNPAQQSRLAVLEQDVAAKMAELDETVVLRRHQGFSAAQKVVLTGRGQEAMERIRAILGQMESAEGDLLRLREQRRQAEMRGTGLAFLGFLLLEVGLLLFIRKLLRRSWTLQERHTRELEQTASDLWAATIVAEQAVKQYRDIYENAVAGIFQTTPEGRLLSANPAMARLLGYETPDELMQFVINVGEHLYVHPADRSRFLGLMSQEGTVCAFETQFRRRDNAILWVSLCARLERDDAGDALYFEGTLEDITERRQAEEALRESEERFHAFMNNSPAVAFM